MYSIGQNSVSTTGNLADSLQEILRQVARETFLGVLAEEVEILCGCKYQPDKDTSCRRAGSEEGYFYDGTERKKIRRPRVRKLSDDGCESEVKLESYQAGQQPGLLEQKLIAALREGVSCRGQKNLHDNAPKTSKSEVSRLWKQEGKKALEHFRSRDLGEEKWLALMLDGIALSDNLLAVVALAITATGKKVILDFELGNSENLETSTALLTRLSHRNFKPAAGIFLAVIDGSKALRKAVSQFFPGAVIQRCLVHKERNVRRHLRRKDYAELARLFKRLRLAQGEQAAAEAAAELHEFVKGKNQQALASLEEAGEELTAVHSLNLPATLHRTFLSTNCIENSFLNTRRKLGRVTRWRPESEQASIWLAFALSSAESGFRRIYKTQDLPSLEEALHKRAKELGIVK